ncbi:MAG: DUF2249 domain-containing protein [Verrucomicrobia bacterium]|nr:DUF2249 domain-containing protein [Verrucomicrobiota bacterium]
MTPTFISKMDLRGLEPPDPMTRVLEAIGSAPAGIIIEAILERRPMFLLDELGRRGQKFSCAPTTDGCWLITIPISDPMVTRSTET